MNLILISMLKSKYLKIPVKTPRCSCWDICCLLLSIEVFILCSSFVPGSVFGIPCSIWRYPNQSHEHFNDEVETFQRQKPIGKSSDEMKPTQIF